MKTIGVVTVGRSDYGVYVPILRRIQSDPDLALHLIVAGMHLSPEFGRTEEYLEADGFEAGDRIEMLLSSDSPEGISKSMGMGLIGFAQSYARLRPDLLLVLGDRFEMHSAACAALPFKIPVAHIHGGELTEGAIDDAFRHSMTKLSHLHFVATEEYASRVRQLGEESWRVIVSGAPSLDNIREMELWSSDELASRFGKALDVAPLLVTYHPVTLEYEKTEWQVAELLEALAVVDLPVVFTSPNADTGGRSIRKMISDFVERDPSRYLISNLGTRGYFSLMACARAMVGNSSSGIVEAPSFGLPVVNIGNRQGGRMRANNIIDVDYRRESVVAGIREALTPEFRRQSEGGSNPFGNGHASERIVRTIKEFSADQLIPKKFIDTFRRSTTSVDPASTANATGE